jgi:hypothetical protein
MGRGIGIDDIARDLAAGEISRRSALKRIAVTALGLGAAASPAGLAHAVGGGCPGDRVKCGGKCCPQNARCRRGKCKCKAGYEKCGRKCVDTDSSVKHCGACGNKCADGQVCADGECVTQICSPGQTQPCYSGPPGTQNVGVCVGGTRTCNAQGTAYGPCVGEVTPSTEICDNGQDDDCDGLIDGADGNDCCTPDCPAGSCDDDGCGGNCACESGFVCDGGICVEQECDADEDCPAIDQCNLGICNDGLCDSMPKPDNSPCNDGNACTQTDTCQNGICVGANPVVCQPSDSCHLAGTCNPRTGQCSNPQAPDGTPCPDGTCLSGFCYVCTASGPEVCDGRDNDCDGFIDDEPAGVGMTCSCGGETTGVIRCRSAPPSGLYCDCS